MTFTPHFALEPRSMRRTKAPDEHYNHFGVAKAAHDLRERGVSVQLGAHGQRAGLGAHWELWMLAQGGFSPWQAYRAATIDGARYIGLDRDLGSIEAGKLADLVLWRLDGLAHDGIDDKLAALVFGPPAPVELALVGGRPIVERDELVHADAETLARQARRAHRRIMKNQ